MLSFLSAGTYRCAVKTSILRSLGLHLGTLGDHLGLILRPLSLLRDLLGAIWRRNRILGVHRKDWAPLWETLLAPKITKIEKISTKGGVQTAVQKKCALGARPKRPNV